MFLPIVNVVTILCNVYSENFYSIDKLKYQAVGNELLTVEITAQVCSGC